MRGAGQTEIGVTAAAHIAESATDVDTSIAVYCRRNFHRVTWMTVSAVGIFMYRVREFKVTTSAQNNKSYVGTEL